MRWRTRHARLIGFGSALVAVPVLTVALAHRGPATRIALGDASGVLIVNNLRAVQLPARVGVDGRPVMQIRGSVEALDSSVAMLDGRNIRPQGPGETEATVEIGDRMARIRVLVHERVRSFAGLRPDQRLVVAPVHLARSDTVRLSLPVGALWIKYLALRGGEPPPTMELGVIGSCGPGDGLRVYRIPTRRVRNELLSLRRRHRPSRTRSGGLARRGGLAGSGANGER